jgi:uncharacterized membrane protein YfcA
MEFYESFASQHEFIGLSLVVLGLGVGILSGLLGVGGGILMTPALHLLGMPMPIAVGTTLTQMMASSLTASIRHYRSKNLSIKLALAFALPAFIGVHVGKKLLVYWQSLELADQYSGLFYTVLLLYMGIVMARRQKFKSENTDAAPRFRRLRLLRSMLALSPVFTVHNPQATDETDEKIKVAATIPVSIGTGVGLVSSLTGLGGGFFYVPTMLNLLGLSMRVAVGTSVGTVFLGSVIGALSFGVEGLVDYTVALVLALGSSMGGYLGASATRYVKGQSIRYLFIALVLAASASMGLNLLRYKFMANLLLFSTSALVVLAAIANAAYHFRAERKNAL